MKQQECCAPKACECDRCTHSGGDEGGSRKCLVARCYNYLPRPVEPNQLIDLIGRYRTIILKPLLSERSRRTINSGNITDLRPA